MYEVHVKACSLFMSLLSMCEVMRLHMYIALVGLDWGYKKVCWGLSEVKSKYANGLLMPLMMLLVSLDLYMTL